ncbi:Serine/threonine-protein phosphatase [Sergentomyia squamirostris]
MDHLMGILRVCVSFFVFSTQNGLPSPENPYVFNGDFVDRGRKSLEVFLLLLTCQILYPDGVFLNRGNHEDSVMNTRYGFTREVHQKYKHNAERLLKLIEGVYRWLPLGTIINNRVLVVHGGISDSTDLDLVRSLDRSRFTSLLRPPLAEGNNQGLNDMDRAEWKQVFDMLWSDPQPNEGCRPNSLRGAGTYFGPDVTKSFLEKHKLNFLVRSHECKPEGHETIHNDQVITIFSASNYYEIASNKGAYLKLDPRLEKHFVQYTAAASKTRKLTFRQRVGLVESSAIRELAAQLRKCRAELEEEFLLRDVAQTGFLTLAQWCEAMETATYLGLPWRLLRDRLAPVEANHPPTTVRYIKTLELLDSDSMRSHPGSVSVAESLYRNKASLEAIFNIMDKDNSGHITVEEFAEACEVLHTHIPEFGTVKELMKMCVLMDINGDGSVDLNEFLEAFRLCDQSRRGLRLPIDEILKEDGGEQDKNKTVDENGVPVAGCSKVQTTSDTGKSQSDETVKDKQAKENPVKKNQELMKNADIIEKADIEPENKNKEAAKATVDDFDEYDLMDTDEDSDFEDPVLDEDHNIDDAPKKVAPKATDDEDI